VQQVTDVTDDLERTAQIVGDCVRERFEFTVRGKELGSALVHASFEIVFGLLQRHIALLNFSQHFIEGVGEGLEFVVTLGGLKAKRVVAIARNQAGGARERDDGFGEESAEDGPDKHCNAEAEKENSPGNCSVPDCLLPQVFQMRLNVDSPNLFSLDDNSRCDQDINPILPTGSQGAWRYGPRLNRVNSIGQILRERFARLGVDRSAGDIARVAQ
jgi:hypothetical protein